MAICKARAEQVFGLHFADRLYQCLELSYGTQATKLVVILIMQL